MEYLRNQIHICCQIWKPIDTLRIEKVQINILLRQCLTPDHQPDVPVSCSNNPSWNNYNVHCLDILCHPLEVPCRALVWSALLYHQSGTTGMPPALGNSITRTSEMHSSPITCTCQKTTQSRGQHSQVQTWASF